MFPASRDRFKQQKKKKKKKSKCEHWEEDGGCHISANVRV